MAADGSLIFDTGLDSSGFNKGVTVLKTAAVTAAAAVTTAFTAASVAAVNVGTSFTSAMSQVSATMGITRMSEEYSLLAASAEEMGAKTKYSASQAGEALNYLALAGYDAQKSVAALPTVLNVAAAGGIELAYASDMITDSMSALGLGMEELESFSDKLAKASQKSNTSVAQLGEAILTVGGTAKSLAGGVTELNTMLGLIADNGIKGAEGGTALRNIILSLSAPTDNAAAALSRLNVNAFDGAGQMRELSEVFGDLNTALAPLTEQEKTQALSEIFNKVDLKAVNALLGTSAERFNELEDYISDCDGAAAQMAETMSDNLQGDMDNFNSALEGLGIAAFSKFENPMRSAVQNVTKDISEMIDEVKDGELSESFDQLSDGVGQLATALVDFTANDAMPVLIRSMAAIVSHGKEIVNTLISVGAAIVVFKGLTVFVPFESSIRKANLALLEMEARSGEAAVAQAYLSGSLTASQTAAGIFTGRISAATLATSAFKAVASSPILLASILTGVVVAAWKYTNSISEATETTQNAAQAAEDYNTALENQEKLLRKNQGSLEADKTELTQKVEIYEKLREQYELTGEGEQDLIDIAKEIQALSPTTIQFVDEETQSYLSLAGAVDDVITAMERKYQIDNAQSDWEFAQGELSELKAQRDELQKEREQLEADFVDKYGVSSDQAGLANTFFAYFLFDVIGIGYAKRRINENEKAMLELNTAIADAESRSANALKDIQGIYLGESTTAETAVQSWSEQVSDYMRAMAKPTEEKSQQAATIISDTWAKATEKLESGFKSLEHDYAVGLISDEADLYERKRALVAEYGNAELEEHWKFYEELYTYEKDSEEKRLEAAKNSREKSLTETKDGLKKQLTAVTDNINSIVSEYKSALSELESNISGYKNRLLSVGDIFSVTESTDKNGNKKRTIAIEDAKKQLEEMRKYHKYITELKASGASDGLLSELTSLDFADGAVLGKYLTGLNKSDFNDINKLYEDREALADELSKELYAPEAKALNDTLTGCIDAALDGLPEQARLAGKTMLSSMIDGMDISGGDLSEEITAFANSFTELYNSALEEVDISHGFSVVLGGMNMYQMGKDLAADLSRGFNEELQKNINDIRIQQTVTGAKLSGAGAAAGTNQTTAQTNEPIINDITVNTTVQVDGEEVSRSTERRRNEYKRRTG